MGHWGIVAPELFTAMTYERVLTCYIIQYSMKLQVYTQEELDLLTAWGHINIPRRKGAAISPSEKGVRVYPEGKVVKSPKSKMGCSSLK